ncbi:MAG TPA: hypothetical protein DDW52_11150 [Planctomycetaceae bacterium]|nr:hypothetical protein [Planctomycetaceae bacterium]
MFDLPVWTMGWGSVARSALHNRAVDLLNASPETAIVTRLSVTIVWRAMCLQTNDPASVE